MAGANDCVFFIPECGCGMADGAMRMWARMPTVPGHNNISLHSLAAMDDIQALLGAHIK